MSISINVTPAASGGTFTVGSVSSQNLTLEVTGGIGPPGLGNLMLAEGDGIDIATVGNVATISTNLTIPANLADLSDVAAAAPSAGQVLAWNGTAWTAAADNALTLSTSAGLDLGTAAVGTSGEAARADHVHNLPTFAEITTGTATVTGDLTLDPSTGGVIVAGGTAGSGSLTLNCEANTHGVTIQGPPHSAAATYTLTLPASAGAANQVLQTDGSGGLSWADQTAGGGITWASEPAASNSTGTAGQIAYGSGFFYLHDGTEWRRAALSTFGTVAPAETFDLLTEASDRLMTETGDSLDHDGVGGGGVATLTITSQPQNTTAAGGEASFAVAATVSDGSTLTYQWQEERLANDGATWTQQTLPRSNDWYGVTYGNGTFVAVGGDNSNIALTSTDGTTWTQQTLPLSANWWSVTYGNGTFVAVSRSAPAATSPDGITWTQQSLPLSADWVSVTYGNGIFVAVAAGSSIAATSPDGVTWTQQTLPLSAGWWSVTYGNGTFVAVSITGDIAASSADGITWTQRTLPASTGWERVAYGNGTFVAVPTYSNIAATSPDGVTWTARTLPITENWRGVAYGNGVFVAVSILGAATSPDGITWTQQTILSNQIAWWTVTYGDGVFLTVAKAGTVAATSTSTTAQFFPISGETASTLNLTGLTSDDDGERYRIVVDSPSVEPVTSDPATLTVT